MDINHNVLHPPERESFGGLSEHDTVVVAAITAAHDVGLHQRSCAGATNDTSTGEHTLQCDLCACAKVGIVGSVGKTAAGGSDYTLVLDKLSENLGTTALLEEVQDGVDEIDQRIEQMAATTFLVAKFAVR